MRILALAIALVLPSLAQAASIRITATVVVSTNAPIGNTNEITINASTRTFTNQVTASPATLIQETNSMPWTATNILNHLTDYKVSPAHVLLQSSPTNVMIRGAVDEALTVTLAGGWGHVTYTTQTVQSPTFMVRAPLTVEAATNRTTIASYLVRDLSDYSTEAFDTNSVANSNFITKGASPDQFITSPLRVTGTLRSTSQVLLTNGFTSSLTNINSVSSNHVNYGNAIRSEGSGGNSFQVGSNALAIGDLSTAVGNGASAQTNFATAIGIDSIAMGYGSVALGQGAVASNQFATAIGQASFAGRNGTALGQGAKATNEQSMAVGIGAVADGTNSIAIGVEATATMYQSAAIGDASSSAYIRGLALGAGATTDDTNQIKLGTSTETVSIPGQLRVTGSITNATLRGTNIINGQVVYTPVAVTSLANGYNSAVAVNQSYIRFSGPSAAYTNVGFSAANKMDGRRHLLQFDNPGLSFTILDNSGLDAGETNRIFTGTGALVNSTNNPAFAEIIRDEVVNRWRLLWFR